MSDLTDKLDRTAQRQAGELARTDDAPTTIYQRLQAMEPQIATALPSHISARQFLRFALTELRLSPKLQACTPESLMGALLLSAQLGLVPGPLGHVYLVPYGKELTFQIGYKGYIELAARSGITISGHVVREGDQFDYELGTSTRLTHKPELRQPGEPYAWWAMAERTETGRVLGVEVLNREQVETFRRRSRAATKGPWVTDYDAMALKTVVKRLVKLLPLSTEQAESMSQDDTRPTYQPTTDELTVARASIDDDDELGEADDDTEAQVVDATSTERPSERAMAATEADEATS